MYIQQHHQVVPRALPARGVCNTRPNAHPTVDRQASHDAPHPTPPRARAPAPHPRPSTPSYPVPQRDATVVGATPVTSTGAHMVVWWSAAVRASMVVVAVAAPSQAAAVTPGSRARETPLALREIFAAGEVNPNNFSVAAFRIPGFVAVPALLPNHLTIERDGSQSAAVPPSPTMERRGGGGVNQRWWYWQRLGSMHGRCPPTPLEDQHRNRFIHPTFCV